MARLDLSRDPAHLVRVRVRVKFGVGVGVGVRVGVRARVRIRVRGRVRVRVRLGSWRAAPPDYPTGPPPYLGAPPAASQAVVPQEVVACLVEGVAASPWMVCVAMVSIAHDRGTRR